MAIYEWAKAQIRNGSSISVAGGYTAPILGEAHRRFMEDAGRNARVFIGNHRLYLYYNSESGDVFIPKYYSSQSVNEIKKDFLYFISRGDDNEDVKYKCIERNY